ncbi:uncharacterized protein LOC107765451 [Nicotiana tabacum]|uniref:Uncharacterized protein LOC107765451 n=1 Tax=Nicotiana tabacum TaxID=4097 RepID=A0AC58S5X9_TOBAC
MHDFIMAEDCKLWDIICDGPYVPTRVLQELPFSMAKTNKEYTEVDNIAVEKNFHTKNILVYGIGPEEYNRISTCDTAKEICEALQTAHERTTQVKQSKIDMLTTEYELFKMRDGESIQDMHTRFTSIINELHSVDEIILRNKLELTVEELIGNLKTHELKKKINSEKREPKREKNLVLKDDYNDSSEEDSDMAYLTKRFQKMCGKPRHFMKDCPLLKKEFSKNHHEKTTKTNPVPVKDFKRKRSVDNMMRQSLAAWGDSSSESEDEPDTGDSSMMAVEDDVLITGFHSLVEDRDSLTLELGESEQTRDDLVVAVTDHKKTVETLRKEKSDMLAEIADLRETIVKPWTKSKPESSRKGKEIASEEHIRLESEVKAMRFRMCAEIEKNELFQTNLERVNDDLEKSLKWTWEQGSKGRKLPHNPHSKYVTISDNWPYTRCGNTKGFNEDVQAKNQSVQKNKVFAETVTTKEGPGNKVKFLSKICTVTDLVTGEIVLVAKRYKNIYVADFESLQNSDLSCLKAVDDEAELWHRRLGYATPSTPQQNGAVERKDKTLGEMARTILIDSGIAKNFWAETVNTACYLVNSVHVIFDDSYPSLEKSAEEDQDEGPSLVPGEIINMINGKADMMSQVKEPNEENAASSSTKPSTSIKTTEVEERVVDAV